MSGFEVLVSLLLASVVLAAIARRLGVPYPALLALGGALLAFLPGAPTFTIEPRLALALFVAPVLLDGAYDASARDLRENWVPVASLVLVSVGLTTAAVAWCTRSSRRCRGRLLLLSERLCRRRTRPPRQRCCARSVRRIASA